MYNLDTLLKDIDMQNTALFIGAGASRCSLMPIHQLPDGNEMKLELYKYHFGQVSDNTLQTYEKQFKKTYGIKEDYIPPEMVWEKCLVEHGENLTPYFRLLNELFGKGKYTPPNYKFIAWLNLMENRKINQIITTNFDEKIEDAYGLLQKRGLFADKTVLTAADDADFSHFSGKIKDTTIIYKLHGTISKPFTIVSSVTDMEKELSKPKYTILTDIFKSNSIIIFVGYACNDSDIFQALLKISQEVHDVKIVWVKRNQVKHNSNIEKILSAFNSTNNVIISESYDFLKKLFDTYVDREKISMDLIENHINFLNNLIQNKTVGTLINRNKCPIPDVLYGEIDFPEKLQKDIFKIINSFDIQRLRDIKQLSFAQYRYPGATHTRFSHSLGVAYLVSLALDNSNFKDVSEDDKKNTIFAALLHDVGHGPLGHVLDKFYDRIQKGNEHEKYTRKFIDEGLIDLREVLKDINMNLTEVKDRTVFKTDNIEELHRYADKIFLAWLLTDYALDLDRVDFLMRDLLMTQYKGKLPNKIQKEIVPLKHPMGEILNDMTIDFINCLCVGTVNELDDAYKSKFPENAKILYLDNKDNKGIYNLDELLEFLLGIYVEMYQNVYYNDKISSAEVMMAKALHLAYDAGDIDRSSLYTFTDLELYSYLENLENDLIREIVFSVKYRRFFKPIVEFDLDLPKEMHAVEIETQIAAKFDLDQNDFKSLVIVNSPRKKELKNLFVKRNEKITLYPKISEFSNKLSNIKGKIFIHPNNKKFSTTNVKQELVTFLLNIGIKANIVSEDKKMEPIKQFATLDSWCK